MTGKIVDRVEVVTSVQRRRRWSAEEKARMVQETYAPEASVSLVARRHGIAPNQLFTWRRLHAEGALCAVSAGEEVVAASDYRALQQQVRELQRLLGKKTLEAEILREALDLAHQKKTVALGLAKSRGRPVSAVAQALGVARSNLAAQAAPVPRLRRAAAASRSPTPSCWPRSRPSSRTCRPAATAGCTRSSAARGRRTAGRRPTPSASIGS